MTCATETKRYGLLFGATSEYRLYPVSLIICCRYSNLCRSVQFSPLNVPSIIEVNNLWCLTSLSTIFPFSHNFQDPLICHYLNICCSTTSQIPLRFVCQFSLLSRFHTYKKIPQQVQIVSGKKFTETWQQTTSVLLTVHGGIAWIFSWILVFKTYLLDHRCYASVV